MSVVKVSLFIIAEDLVCLTYGFELAVCFGSVIFGDLIRMTGKRSLIISEKVVFF